MKKGKIKTTKRLDGYKISVPYRLFGFVLMLCLQQLHADQADLNSPLPDPLTLNYALSLLDSHNPDLALMQAEVEKAIAEKHKELAKSDMEVKITERLRWVQPSGLLDEGAQGDNWLGLVLGKSIYDFGRIRERANAASAEIDSARQLLQETKFDKHLEVMENYFAVVVSDLQFSRDNEAMAVAYIQFDRTKDRKKLGQVSDIDLLKIESEYQKARRERVRSESMQRLTRARLANTLNRPGELSANLTEPELNPNPENLDLDELVKQVSTYNPRLLALKSLMEKEHARLRAVKSEYWPSIYGQIEVAEYTRDLPSRDQWSVGIAIEIPVYLGNRIRSERRVQHANIDRARAHYEKLKMDINQSVLELWFELETLTAQLREMQTLTDYQDLYLDRARALYDLEYRTDLGDAMVKSSNTRLLLAQTRYNIVLTKARLLALAGQNPQAVLGENK